MTREDQFAQLMKRPSLEEVTTRYQQMQQDIATALADTLGPPQWVQDDPTGGGSLCGREFNDLGSDARTKSLPMLSRHAAIPDDQWDQAVRIAETIARRNGFNQTVVIVDRPGQHTVDFKNEWGGRFGLDSGAHSVLSVQTGCHLTEEAQRRGKPTPPRHGS
jgi:predicted LppA-like lipoprotein